jgi:hypothetical protein
MNADELEALADRCKTATGPDRDLDCAIAAAVGWREIELPHGSRYCISPDGRECSHGLIAYAPRFTASLDAAMTLVPEGWWWVADGHARASLFREDAADQIISKAATPSLALCSAALRARAAHKEQPDE